MPFHNFTFHMLVNAQEKQDSLFYHPLEVETMLPRVVTNYRSYQENKCSMYVYHWEVDIRSGVESRTLQADGTSSSRFCNQRTWERCGIKGWPLKGPLVKDPTLKNLEKNQLGQIFRGKRENQRPLNLSGVFSQGHNTEWSCSFSAPVQHSTMFLCYTVIPFFESSLRTAA